MEYYGKKLVDYYDLLFAGIPEDIDFYVEEAHKAGGPVLEIGCGTGRISIHIAEAGIEVTGLDASEDMLAIIKQKIAMLDDDVQRRIQIAEGDMVSFSLEKKFNLIMIPCRAFLQLLTPEDQRATIYCLREHLKENGKLILNFFDPKINVLVENSGVLIKGEEAIDPTTGNKILYWHSTQNDMEHQLRKIDFIFEEQDVNGKVISRTVAPLTMRWIYRYEMQYLLELCGFKVEALYGDFNRGPFRYGGEQIWVCVRK